MTLTPVQISVGHSYSSKKDNTTLGNYLTVTKFTFTRSVIVLKVPFVRTDLYSGPHAVSEATSHPPKRGTWYWTLSPIEASSLVVSPFGIFHVLSSDKLLLDPFQTMKEM